MQPKKIQGKTKLPSKPANNHRGFYIQQKSNYARIPKLYWIVRESIPASISSTKKHRYQDYYAYPNTYQAAKKLCDELAKDRPDYHKGRKHGFKLKK